MKLGVFKQEGNLERGQSYVSSAADPLLRKFLLAEASTTINQHMVIISESKLLLLILLMESLTIAPNNG